MDSENRNTAVIDYTYSLTDEDRLEYALKIAELDEQDDSLENEKKMTTASFKARIDENHTNRKKLSKAIRSGSECRAGECEIVNDFDKGIVSFRLIETGCFVYSRKMSNEERQLNLFGGE